MTYTNLADLIRAYQRGDVLRRDFMREASRLGIGITLIASILHRVQPVPPSTNPSPDLPDKEAPDAH